MNYGRYDRDTAAGRVYRVLLDAGDWVGGWDLTLRARVTAASTRVSELRHQGVPVEHRREGTRNYYRLGPEQMTLL